jgi:hypothetical protein
MQIKCTSCGATQELATNHQCGYCGSAIEQEKAQENYKSATTGKIGNLMMMAETAIDATNWEEALQFYNQVLTKEITNSDAWLGKGIAIVYTSKIGDIKTTEAIAYWKNAIKHAENTDAMGKRVAKEINHVVQVFFPNILNHYLEFSSLDDSYVDLANRFLILEKAMDYAIQICPNEAELFQTGFDLCETVIKAPGASATSDQYAAAGAAIFNTLAGNKYSAKGDQNDWAKANERKKQIQNFGSKIQVVANKYLVGLIKLGVKSEQDRPTIIDIKPIDEGMYKKLYLEFGISIIAVIIIVLIIPTISDSLISFWIITIAWLVYYYFSFNSRCKMKLGMSFSEAYKVLKKNK